MSEAAAVAPTLKLAKLYIDPSVEPSPAPEARSRFRRTLIGGDENAALWGKLANIVTVVTAEGSVEDVLELRPCVTDAGCEALFKAIASSNFAVTQLRNGGKPAGRSPVHLFISLTVECEARGAESAEPPLGWRASGFVTAQLPTQPRTIAHLVPQQLWALVVNAENQITLVERVKSAFIARRSLFDEDGRETSTWRAVSELPVARPRMLHTAEPSDPIHSASSLERPNSGSASSSGYLGRRHLPGRGTHPSRPPSWASSSSAPHWTPPVERAGRWEYYEDDEEGRWRKFQRVDSRTPSWHPSLLQGQYPSPSPRPSTGYTWRPASPAAAHVDPKSPYSHHEVIWAMLMPLVELRHVVVSIAERAAIISAAYEAMGETRDHPDFDARSTFDLAVVLPALLAVKVDDVRYQPTLERLIAQHEATSHEREAPAGSLA